MRTEIPIPTDRLEEFCRQLAWRDFFGQVTAAFPDIARKNYRPGPAWHEDRRALDAWREGQTGIPIVDAGLRQLAAEGFMHNRARMVTASFLTRNLGIDWRHGFAHFDSPLCAGTGRPRPRLDPGAVEAAPGPAGPAGVSGPAGGAGLTGVHVLFTAAIRTLPRTGLVRSRRSGHFLTN